MEEGTIKVRRPYPRTVSLENNTPLNLRLMTPADSHRIVTFARSLPEDDLLFLRTDITKAFVVMLWGQNIKAGLTVTVIGLAKCTPLGDTSTRGAPTMSNAPEKNSSVT